MEESCMMQQKSFIIKGCTIHGEDRTIEEGYMKVANGKIIEMGTVQTLNEDEQSIEEVQVPKAYHIIPGMIDVHIHGAAGADTMDGTVEAIETIAKRLPEEGTTSFLATTMTQSNENITAALTAVKEYQSITESIYAEVIGVHLEGPFINVHKAGAQPSEYIIEPDVAMFQKWNEASGQQIKLVTLAPEVNGADELIDYLVAHDIVVSIGHSNGTYHDVVAAVKKGASHVTHLFNGMTGMHHREPGVVGGALLLDELHVEMIADGIHICPEMIELAYRQKGADRIVLITDSIRAKCLQNGQYDLGGQQVTVLHDRATLEDNTLAGSILKLNEGARHFQRYTGCSMQEVIQVTSVNPAKELNVYDRKGSLSIGKDADFVVVDDDFNVMFTYCRGQLAYEKETVQ